MIQPQSSAAFTSSDRLCVSSGAASFGSWSESATRRLWTPTEERKRTRHPAPLHTFHAGRTHTHTHSVCLFFFHIRAPHHESSLVFPSLFFFTNDFNYFATCSTETSKMTGSKGLFVIEVTACACARVRVPPCRLPHALINSGLFL